VRSRNIPISKAILQVQVKKVAGILGKMIKALNKCMKNFKNRNCIAFRETGNVNV
jgi:hypothetical protein